MVNDALFKDATWEQIRQPRENPTLAERRQPQSGLIASILQPPREETPPRSADGCRQVAGSACPVHRHDPGETRQCGQAGPVNQETATLKFRQRTLNREIGNVQANQISESGVHVVGTNINAGTWYTSGDGGQNDNACYFATLSGSNTSDPTPTCTGARSGTRRPRRGRRFLTRRRCCCR
jgi:hypothetical protein